MADARVIAGGKRLAFTMLATFIVTCQLWLGLWGIDDAFARGHNGYNSSAYLLSARNSLRFEVLFPHQKYTDPAPPEPGSAYTHAPLATHLANLAAVSVLGDRPRAVRAVGALHGVLVALALLWVVARHWSRGHALLATALYVALPINAIYLNMANHSLGFQFWSLLALDRYLCFRARRHVSALLALVAFTWLATSWDWPAYYVAFVIALDWLLRYVAAHRRGEREDSLGRFALTFGGYCLGVLLALGAFVLTVHWLGGGTRELLATFRDRQSAGDVEYARALATIPGLMFGLPVLLACAVYLSRFSWRVLRSKTSPRDVIPLAFAFAGVLHALLFKSSAVVHEYWLWPALPFVAIATSEVTLAAGSALSALFQELPSQRRALLSAASFAIVSLLPLSLLAHSLEVVPRGRRVGGSMWFVSNVRGDVPDAYDSGRAELRFAELVRAATQRSTGVLIDPSLKRFDLEERFDVTLDRAQRARPEPNADSPTVPGVDGWVLIGSLAGLDTEEVLAQAGDYAVTFYDHYFMIDMRVEDRAVRVIRLAPRAPRLISRWLSADEVGVLQVRDRAREAALLQTRARGN